MPKTFGVIFLSDAFGLELVNSKLIADKIAKVLACDVWVPDLFDGRIILNPCPSLNSYSTCSLASSGIFESSTAHVHPSSLLVPPRYLSSRADLLSPTQSLPVHQKRQRAEQIRQTWRCGVCQRCYPYLQMYGNTYRVPDIALVLALPFVSRLSKPLTASRSVILLR